jgi:hypothetical protein
MAGLFAARTWQHGLYIASCALLSVSALLPMAHASGAYRPGEQVISIAGGWSGSGRATLTMPRGTPSAVVILMPGGAAT